MSTKHAPETEQKDLDLGEVYTRTELWIENNKKAVTYGGLGLVVVVLLAVGYKKLYAEPRATEASENIWKAQYYFEIDSLDKAINGDGNYYGFDYIASEYGGTPSGSLAHFYLGSIYMQKGEYELAIEHYKKASPGDDVLRVLAVGNQGDALVELGRTDEALARFEKAASMETNDFTTPLFLMKAGLIYQEKGDWKKAAKAFGRIAQEFPNSAEVMQARKHLGRAEQMAG
ncbi:MAG: tetratricopeptide repeat protein [Flavobacteriales bacterium]|nr:tetratricopeptide repeat protein [Flavobacteriales bacterium]